MDLGSKQKRNGTIALVLSALMGASIGVAATSCGGGGSDPLARVADRTITDEEFAAYLRFRSMSPRGDDAMQEALDEYLRREALASAIEDSDLLDQDVIEAELREFRKEMLISRYFDRFLRTAVTDDAVQNYYNEHAADYEDREVHVAHILIRTNRRMSDEERQAAQTRAQEAHSQLTSGRDFAEVAAQFSEDAVSASRGGDLGWVREGAIDARFSERAFATEAGQVTEPFETPFGFHVLRVMEAPATRRRPLSAVEGDIRYQLRAQAREAEITRLLEAVRIQQREDGYHPPARPTVGEGEGEGEGEERETERPREEPAREPGERTEERTEEAPPPPPEAQPEAPPAEPPAEGAPH